MYLGVFLILKSNKNRLKPARSANPKDPAPARL